MEEHELTAWLGDTEVTDEQRAALHRAADMTATRYGDDMTGEREQAFTTAAQVILGDDTLDRATAVYEQARRAERDAMAALTGAIIAASQTQNELDISRQTGLNRRTIRKALGK